MSPGWEEAFWIKVGMSHTTNLRNGPAQYISWTFPVPYMEKHMVLCKYNKTNEISWVCLRQIGNNSLFISISTVLLSEFTTYLVLLDPKDETITFKTQKYLNKLKHAVHPVLCSNDIYAVFRQSCTHHIHNDHMIGDLLGPFHQLLMCTSYAFCHHINGIK